MTVDLRSQIANYEEDVWFHWHIAVKTFLEYAAIILGILLIPVPRTVLKVREISAFIGARSADDKRKPPNMKSHPAVRLGHWIKKARRSREIVARVFAGEIGILAGWQATPDVPDGQSGGAACV